MKKFIYLLVFSLCFAACNAPRDNRNPLDKQLEDAIDFVDLPQVQSLLDKGANPNLRDDSGDPVLLTIAMLSLHEEDGEIMKLLFAAGADPNITGKDGDTALMAASRNGNTDLVKILLDAGAKPDLVDEDGFTALMRAADQGYDDVVKLLLAAGANPNLKQADMTPLYIAILSNRASTVRVLLEGGANPNLAPHEHGTLLDSARIAHNAEIEKILLEFGAIDQNVADQYAADNTQANMRAAEALNIMSPVKTAIQKYITETGKFPSSFEVLSAILPESLAKYSVDNDKILTQNYVYILKDGRLDVLARTDEMPSFSWMSSLADDLTTFQANSSYCYYLKTEEKAALQDQICRSFTNNSKINYGVGYAYLL